MCWWTEFFAEHDLLASKTGSLGLIPMTLSARFSPSGSHHIRLSSTIYNPHTIQNTYSRRRLRSTDSIASYVPATC